jgi:hypothetical protein
MNELRSEILNGSPQLIKAKNMPSNLFSKIMRKNNDYSYLFGVEWCKLKSKYVFFYIKIGKKMDIEKFEVIERSLFTKM